MYAQEMVRMLALPKGAALMGPIAFDPPVGITGLVGRNGSRCSPTQIGLVGDEVGMSEREESGKGG
jgi:hypothetical protein